MSKDSFLVQLSLYNFDDIAYILFVYDVLKENDLINVDDDIESIAENVIIKYNELLEDFNNQSDHNYFTEFVNKKYPQK